MLKTKLSNLFYPLKIPLEDIKPDYTENRGDDAGGSKKMAAWYKYRKLDPDKLEVGPTCRQNIKKTLSEKHP